MSALPGKGPVNFANVGDDRLHLIGLDLAPLRLAKRPALAAFTGFSTAVSDDFDAGNNVITLTFRSGVSHVCEQANTASMRSRG